MANTCIIGYTGFIGSNLIRQADFSHRYRSTNIEDIRGHSYDYLVCAGVSAAKYQANQFPDLDRAAIDRLLNNLAQAKAAQAVLISTVDVFPVTRDVDESFDCGGRPNHAYGTNRLYMESRFKELFPHAYIVRLPGLFGHGLKKNVIFDLLNDNCLDVINPDSVFQYYDVSSLWTDLETVRKHNIPLINLVTEPIATRDILRRYFPHKQVGSRAAGSAYYDIRSRHVSRLSGQQYYLFDAAQTLNRLGTFIQNYQMSEDV